MFAHTNLRLFRKFKLGTILLSKNNYTLSKNAKSIHFDDL